VTAAIGAGDITAGAAGALHQMSTVFFLIAELAACAMLVGFGVAALGTRALPRWWAIVSLLLAVLLVVGPVGWLGVIFGMPLWTLLSSAVLLRDGARELVAAPASSPA
jgi:phosphoglycerol transferase MdoB-like AlkP superfamily enzyme